MALPEKLSKNRLIFGLNRNIIALGWVSFFTDISSEMIYPLLPIFLTAVLGTSTTFLGLIEGVAETTASLLKLFSGWLSDHLGKRKVLVLFGYTLSSLSRPLVAVATSGWQVLFIRFLDRVGKGIRTSPRDALLADSAPPEVHGRAFGFQRAMDHAGAVIGPIFAFLLISFVTQEYRTIFGLAFIPGICAVSLLFWGVKEKITPSPQASPSAQRITIKPFPRPFRFFCWP